MWPAARTGQWRRRWAIPALAALAAGMAAAPAAPAAAAQTGARQTGATQTGAAKPAAVTRAAARGMSPVRQAEAIVARMTLAQKITELHGIQNGQHQRYVPGIPSLGVPPLVITNGPAGVGPGDDPAQQPATALPAPISLAATFDPSLAGQYGKVIGEEAADLGNNLVEGPDVNIVRVPQAGRTFESLSEDPYLTSSIGTAEIKGIQAQPGMIAEVKHFDAYEQETYRNTPQDNNIVSDRVLHEIYDPPFEQAITKGGAQSVMCSYATVNGVYSCQDQYLLSTTVDQRWGFNGFVQSDFGAAHSTVASALAGMALEMPAGDYYAAPMNQAVLDDQVPMATVNQLLVDRFAAMIRQGLFSHPVSTSTIPAQADGRFSLSAAEQGMVLLKNSGAALPLSASPRNSIAVIGPYGGSAMTGGGGSSHVSPLFTVSPVRGIENADPGARVTYDSGSDIASAVAAAKAAGVAVVMVGDTESEGADQSSLSLSGNQDALVEAVAAANPRTIVVVKSGNPVLMPWLSQVPAVLEAWYPGEEDGNAVAAVLFGSVDPSGKLPVTFPASQSATPTSSPSQFPGTNGEVRYSEGLDVGYRGYDAENITPMFPFGYGLSYTTFAFSHLKVNPPAVRNAQSGPGAASCDCNGQATRLGTVSATVTNTGKVAGADVAQLYLGDPSAAGEPPRQLEGFDKVFLSPGQSARVRFPLTGHDLSYWDDTANGWVVPDGTFQVYVGDSSALPGLPLRGRFRVTRTVGARYATLSAPTAPVSPDTTIPVSATFINDGGYPVMGAVPALRLPAGWAATDAGGPAVVSLAPGRSVTEKWSVRVPLGAQGTSAVLAASLTRGRGGPPVGSLSATAGVTVRQALTVSTSSVLVNAGGAATATLTVTSNLPGPAVLGYTASAPSGITVTPAQGTVTIPPSGGTVTLEARAGAGLSPGAYEVPLSFRIGSYALNPGQVPVNVPYGSVAAAFGNTGISDDTDTGAASFDGNGASYSAQALASAGVTPGAALSFDGIGFTWPDVASGQPDNVVADGQAIDVSGQGSELGLLDSSTYGVSSGTGTITYTDGSTQSFSLTVDDWYKAAPAGSNAVIVAPYRNTPGNVQDQNVVNVFEQSIPLQAGKTVAAVTLPDVSAAAAAGTVTLHVFAIGIGGLQPGRASVARVGCVRDLRRPGNVDRDHSKSRARDGRET